MSYDCLRNHFITGIWEKILDFMDTDYVGLDVRYLSNGGTSLPGLNHD